MLWLIMKRYGPKVRPKPKQRPNSSQTPASRSALTARPFAAKPPEAVTHWGQVAEWYDQLVGDEGSEYHQKVIFPGVIRMARAARGVKALDVACGQGAWCRALDERGAKVTGVDASARLIELARSRTDPTVAYHIGDARELGKIQGLCPGSFELATCLLAIQNIDPIQQVFDGVCSLLRNGGRFVMVLMHPAFRGPKYSSWGWEGGDVQYRRVDRYLAPRQEPIISHPGRKDGRYTWTFHRPIQSYINALARAGLLVDHMEEWPSHKTSQPGPRAAAENVARAEIPLFMAIRAVKMARNSPPSDGAAA